jgi:flavodoxin
VRAVVVYESLWGNTAVVARAIAEGLGPETRCLSTLEATPDAIAGVDLIVAGSPVIAFRMPNRKTRASLGHESGAPHAPDLSHPPMQEWLAALTPGHGRSAAFDTRVRGPFGSAAPTIARALHDAGYEPVAKSRGFIVTGKYGPPHEGEIERAREWGAELAEAVLGS